MKQNLICGNPGKGIFFFAIPMLLGNIFQQLYNIADSAIVGRYIGQDALASVGASSAVVFFMITTSVGLTMGFSVVVSQHYGAGRIEKMREAVSTSFIFMIMAAVFLSIAGYLLSGPILRFLRTTSDLYPAAKEYLQIYSSGMIAMYLYNCLAGYFRALGDSKTPLYFLILSTVLNIGLDLLFIVVFSWGVAGAAFATVVSQFVSGLLCILYIAARVPILQFKKEEIVFKFDVLKTMIGYGLPSSLQQSIVSVGMLAIQGLVNSYGSVVLAGYTAASRVDSFATMPIVNFGAAISTYVAQNIGAGKMDRVQDGYKITLLMCTGFSIAVGIAVFLSGNKLISMFLDSEISAEAISVGSHYIKILSIFYILFACMMVTNGVLRGAGDMRAFLCNSAIMITIRIASAYILDGLIGVAAIWWSFPIGWAGGAILAFMRYLSGKWKDKAIENETANQNAV